MTVEFDPATQSLLLVRDVCNRAELVYNAGNCGGNDRGIKSGEEDAESQTNCDHDELETGRVLDCFFWCRSSASLVHLGRISIFDALSSHCRCVAGLDGQLLGDSRRLEGLCMLAR